jgi:transcriptional regulator with XRE-family HTH domain
VSQPETLTNVEKGKLLRESRKRADLTQEQMAKALGLDKTYLSQLENGHRDIDEFYLVRAAEIEKSNKVQAALADKAGTRYDEEAVQSRCHSYLAAVLEECDGDEDKLRWTYVELQRRFPLRPKPLTEDEERERTTVTRAKLIVAGVLPEGQQADAESATSQTAQSKNDKTAAPKVPSPSNQGPQRTPPKRAPK